MSVRALRLVRYTAIIGICSLAGIYAGRVTFAPSTSTTPVTAQSGTTDGAAVPERLPDLQLTDLNGQMRSISEWSTGPLVINFWATWCAPCLREMPMLESVWQARRNDALTIVGIAVDRMEAVGPQVETTGVTYPILVGQSDAMEAAESFGPDFAGLPYTVFAASGGRLVGTFSGELHADQLETILDTLDAASAGLISIDEARQRIAE